MMHLIQGPSDIDERVKYLKAHDVKVRTQGDYRFKYDAIGTILSVGAGIGAALAISALAVVSAPAVLSAVAFGVLTGGLGLAVSSANSMHKYDQYLDSLAAKLKTQQKKPAEIQAKREESLEPVTPQVLYQPANYVAYIDDSGLSKSTVVQPANAQGTRWQAQVRGEPENSPDLTR